MSISQTSRNNIRGEKPIVEIEDQNRVLSLSNMNTDYDTIYEKILSLRDYNNTVRKEQSPQLRTLIGNIIADSIIDEGSELNCICSTIAAKCKIKFNPVKINAMAAGSHVMKLMGVIPSDVVLRVQDSNAEIRVVLKNAVVVKNLGPNVLIGEPGKMDNNIVTFPKQKLIRIADIHGNYVHLPYHSHQGEPPLPYQPYTVKQNVVLYPQEVLNIPVPPSMQCNAVNVTLRRGFEFCGPTTENAKKGYVQIKNNTDDAVLLKKNSHIADLRICKTESFEDFAANLTEMRPKISKIYDIAEEDVSRFLSPKSLEQDKTSYIHEVAIDPDHQMPTLWKKRFLDLCAQFSEIITPQPGRYNGAFGRVNTDIHFASKPPSNLKTHLPKYSSEMLNTLAEKMDTLETWGVLRKPDELGIIPEFVVPSMLTPKPEKGQFRLVTDFTSLNKHIKKLPTVSPSIQEAKDKIAKFKHHVFLDLSNYYYQGGIKIQDSQYLATVHPFKGLLVYTVEPQGLLNSGEHAYERLACIYGDMCASERMTRMADGLYVLGNTYGELYENLHEVFDRAKLANLTFKPSKIIVCPKDTVIFGWRKQGNAWSPTDHTTLPLINAPPPVTVKQLRSWIGSYKQLSACIKDYTVPLTRLEKLTGSDKSSSLKISWTEDLLQDFNTAKNMIKNLEKIYTPTPDDELHTYSDFSAESAAVGGKLIIVRRQGNEKVKLNGGFFSARLNKFQSKWLPCEGESLACKLVLEHFKHYIRENKNTTMHFTDSLPCVQAFNRSKMGAFSSSARIATFLTTISSLNIEIVHTAGKDIKLVDYISRHPNVCSENRCQICRFVKDQVDIGDNAAKLNAVRIDDFLSGKLPTPFLQRQFWIKAQRQDKTHTTLVDLINSAQAPEKKKTKNENTKLKLLHNLYRSGKLKLHKDGLITIKHIEPNGDAYQAVSIPTAFFPGLVHALHHKFSHPSKTQLTKLIGRHFYTPGYQKIIEEVTDSCETCVSLKQLPREIFSESTGDIAGFATNFSADVIERNHQLILIVREKLSSFTITKLIPNQTANTLRESLIAMIIEFIPHSGTVVQVDCATSWATLANESNSSQSELRRLNIIIELGRHMNKNKNPVSDNACKEFHKEILRLKPEGSKLTEIERAIITSNINQRIRKSGYSSKEICFQRELISNQEKHVNDDQLADNIIQERKKRHTKAQETESTDIEVGHNVFMKQDKSKLRARELYKVIQKFSKNGEPWALIQKHNTQFRRKQYEVKIAELILLPGQIKEALSDEEVTGNDLEDIDCNKDRTTTMIDKPNRPRRQAAEAARKKIVNVNKFCVKRSKQEAPLHGWDYNQMLDLWMYDMNESTLITNDVHNQNDEENRVNAENEEEDHQIPSDDQWDTTSRSSTSSGTDEFIPIPDQNEDEESRSTSSNGSTRGYPRLPSDLLACQNLDLPLRIPEVVAATSSNGHGDAQRSRIFTRHRNVPSNYATYHKTGKR